MIPKSNDWIVRDNPVSKLPNFETGKILLPESQALKNMLGLTEQLSKLELTE